MVPLLATINLAASHAEKARLAPLSVVIGFCVGAGFVLLVWAATTIRDRDATDDDFCRACFPDPDSRL